MSNLKKTIQINPELFRLSGNKTKKNRDKREIPTPIISPNNLKNKLAYTDNDDKFTSNLKNGRGINCQYGKYHCCLFRNIVHVESCWLKQWLCNNNNNNNNNNNDIIF